MHSEGADVIDYWLTVDIWLDGEASL